MQKRIFSTMLIIALALTLFGCGAKNEASSRTVYAMDTVMNLTVYGKRGTDALSAAAQELARLDALLDRHDENSGISRINASSGAPTEVDAELAALLSRALELSEITGGAFDITVAPIMDAWGFSTDTPSVPTAETLSALLPRVGSERVTLDAAQSGAVLTLDEGQAIDLGGIAKGAAAGELRTLLAQYDVTSAALDLGGDVCVVGTKPDGSDWRIAVKNPAEPENFLGVLSVSDCFVVTSGVYERYFEQDGVRYHHIIDPATGYSADSGLVSVTVVCADGMSADALSTAVFVAGVDTAQSWRETIDFDFIAVTTDGRVLYTAGLVDKFTPENTTEYRYEQLA